MKHLPANMQQLGLPVVVAPMFLISGPSLVIECCRQGIVGTFPALNHRSTEGFEQWVIEIKEALATMENPAPFGVNLIVHPTNHRLMQDIEVIVKHQVPLVITSLGAVPDLVDAVHSYGGLVFHDVINRRHAEKAVAAGVDGLILVSAGAGGHAGTLNPMAFIHEIRSFFDKTILLSGCISDGQDVASAMQMGADLAYMGTRFINTTEANVDKAYQQMIVESGTSDIVYTAAVSGVSANFMKKSLENAGIPPEMWSRAGKIDFGKELDAAQAEAKAWKTIWSAGQGVAAIQDVLPVADLVQQLKTDFHQSIEAQIELLQKYK
ncbi:MAG: NAD(P)H-dependent flavin oxidoreductase [Spirosomataceae bacterium]